MLQYVNMTKENTDIFRNLAIEAADAVAVLDQWDRELLEAHQESVFDHFSELVPAPPPIAETLEKLRDLIHEAQFRREALIERLVKTGLNDRQIARVSGVAHTTIARRYRKGGRRRSSESEG